MRFMRIIVQRCTISQLVRIAAADDTAVRGAPLCSVVIRLCSSHCNKTATGRWWLSYCSGCSLPRYGCRRLRTVYNRLVRHWTKIPPAAMIKVDNPPERMAGQHRPNRSVSAAWASATPSTPSTSVPMASAAPPSAVVMMIRVLCQVEAQGDERQDDADNQGQRPGDEAEWNADRAHDRDHQPVAQRASDEGDSDEVEEIEERTAKVSATTKPTAQLVTVAKNASPISACTAWAPRPKPKKKPQIGRRNRKKR